MSRTVRGFLSAALVASAIIMASSQATRAQTCVVAAGIPCLADCNGNGALQASEVQRIVAIIAKCDPAAASGCAAVPGGGCNAADRNSDGQLKASELQLAISNSLFCPNNGCPAAAPATNTPTNTVPAVATATNTPVPNSPTFTATFTATATSTPVPPSPTPTMPVGGGASCGLTKDGKCCNMVVDAGEECDDGGTCVFPTPSETAMACTKADDCPGGYCQAFGGDGCANNCTMETTVRFTFSGAQCFGGTKNGQVCTGISTCVGGPFPGKPCATNTDCTVGTNHGVCTSECDTAADGSQCFGVGECTAGTVGANCPSKIAGGFPPVSQFLCSGGTRNGAACNAVTPPTVGLHTPTPTPVCPGGGTCNNPCGASGVCQHRSGSVLQSVGVIIQGLNIGPFTGGEDLVVGKPRADVGDGIVPVAVPAASVLFAPVKVPGLACACPSGAPAPSVHGPNNSGSGFIGCGNAGLPNINIDISRDHNTSPGDPNNGPGACSGGTRAGLVCAKDSDCTGGGTCTNTLKGGGACVGGTNKGKVCHADADCPLSICVSPDDATCSAQEPGPPLGSGAAACVEKNEICTGGTLIGEPCTTNSQCGTSGVCATECNTGSFHPGLCNGPTRLSFSGNGPKGSGVIVTNTAIGVIATPNDGGGCSRAGVCTTFTFNQSAAPTSCQVNVECPSGKTCASAYCTGTCTMGGTIGKSCIKATDCGVGGVCDPGTKFSQPCSGIPGECGTNSVCVPVVTAKGFDGMPCTADDPDTSKGTPQNAPTTTGIASSAVIDAVGTTPQTGSLIFGTTCTGFSSCVTSRQGKPFNCDTLLAANPSVAGAAVASAFNQLDAATIGDDVITVGQTAK